jgi:hypothetical protein|tara:strand:- start:2600 stop:3463 length:864 start_codon:yes stop_codon:yes gene_type:complete
METGASNILLKINFSPSSPNNLLTEKCHLSVEIGLNNFSYCLFDTLTFTYILLKKFDFQAKDIKESCEKITNIIASEDLLQKEFYSSSLAFNNFPSTLVPTPFYKEEKNREILSFNHEIEEVLTDKMHQMDAVNIYSVPIDLLNLINKSFPNTQKKCNSSILIDQLLLQNEKTEKTIVYASIEKKKLEVCVLSENKLEFHNSFTTDTKEDLLYFLLFSMEQLGLSPEKTELVLLDDILKSDEKYNLLYEYVRNISFGNRSENLNFTKELESIKSHQYFCLFSQLLCA